MKPLERWVTQVGVWFSLVFTTVFAGRAFPIASENFVIDLFQQINPRIEYDYTNFLVDLSGYYSRCSNRKKGVQDVRKRNIHPEFGTSIGGLIDYTPGDGKHVKDVESYLSAALPRWIQESPFREQIQHADYFGCSARPACSGFLVFSCLFTPKYGDVRPPPTRPPPTRPPPTYPPRTTQRPTTPAGPQEGFAFTPQQYTVAEGITGTPWDRSHFLENLSGYEIKCAMVDQTSWDFRDSQQKAAKWGISASGIFGFAPNLGDTQDGIEAVLRGWAKRGILPPTKEVGCSLIPDCIVRGQMYVVVACVYRDDNLGFGPNSIIGGLLN